MPEKQAGGAARKSGENLSKPTKSGNISCRRFFTEEARWWSSKEERQNQERNRLEVAEPETPLTSALARTAGENRRICRRRNMAET